MSTPRTYWLLFTAFGLLSALTALRSLVTTGPSTAAAATLLGAGLVLAASLVGVRHPERSGAPAERGPLFYLVGLGVFVYAVGTGLNLLG